MAMHYELFQPNDALALGRITMLRIPKAERVAAPLRSTI
jgi:hypothetical protein